MIRVPIPGAGEVCLSLSPPLEQLGAFARSSSDAPLARYPAGRLRSGDLPAGWLVNRSEEQIGSGRAAYESSRRALERLEPMQLEWLRTVVQDETLAISSRQFGFLWVLCANRLLRNERQKDALFSRIGTPSIGLPSSPRGSSYSIGWGTTRRHVLAGEERLRVRYVVQSERVLFEVLSFSRPRHLLSLLTYPLVVMQQRRFACDATAVMRRAVNGHQATGLGG